MHTTSVQTFRWYHHDTDDSKSWHQETRKKAVTALFNKFFQLDNKMVFKEVVASTLPGQQKRRALRAINLIKEKRCGKLKGRTVADGSVQRDL